MENSKTALCLTEHCRRYPQMQIQDVFKFIYQSSFGCEHMVSSYETVKKYIEEEYSGKKMSSGNEIDALDGDYSRVHLSYINKGLSAETLGKLFFLSAKKETDGTATLKNKLDTAKKLVAENCFSFSVSEFEKEAKKWKAQGYPAVHHSQIFCECYSPSYRVISNKFVPYLPLFAKIDSMTDKERITVAIEGGSASGKSTLGEILSSVYDCNVFHMDDYFLRPEQRTPQRYAEVGGNVDRERFLAEILLPLSKGESITYQRFDCSTFSLAPPINVEPKKLNIVEGAYSMHPDLAGYYDFSVFLNITEEKQKKRILKRNPHMAHRFFEEWIPLEKTYFSHMNIKEKCSMIIDVE